MCTIHVAKTKALISFAVDKLGGYREADLRLCFRISRFLVCDLSNSKFFKKESL